MKKKRQDRRWKTREDQREDLKREEQRQLCFFLKITGPSNNFEFYFSITDPESIFIFPVISFTCDCLRI